MMMASDISQKPQSLLVFLVDQLRNQFVVQHCLKPEADNALMSMSLQVYLLEIDGFNFYMFVLFVFDLMLAYQKRVYHVFFASNISF